MPHLRTRLGITALACALPWAGGGGTLMPAARAVGVVHAAPYTHLLLSVRPERVPQGSRVTVTLRGAQPGELVAFTMQPAFPTGGFGGGIVGQFRADRRGVIGFAYPVGGQWLLGRWRVSAAPPRRGGAPRAVSVTITIVPAATDPAQQGTGTVTAPARAAACGLTFPSSHNLRVLSVASGPGALETLKSGPYSFTLARYSGFNGSVRQALGITPPAGDTVLPFAFGIPGGHYYVGLTNVVRQGAQDRVCLRGIAYRDLGNGARADRTPPVAVTLTGTLGATYGRADLYVGTIHYDVFGRPRAR